MEHEILVAKARQLHKDRFHKDAYDLLVANLEQAKFNNFVFENHPIWWSEISAGLVKLTRRSSIDSEFLKQVWDDKKFLYRFHRHANKLPDTPNIENNRIVMSVADNGVGISPEIEAVVFELLRTNKESGMGIGLWLSKTIIDTHQGNISFTTQVNQGTRFVVNLPLTTEKMFF